MFVRLLKSKKGEGERMFEFISNNVSKSVIEFGLSIILEVDITSLMEKNDLALDKFIK